MRLRITPFNSGSFKLEWLDGATVVHTEEFRIEPNREGCSFTSAVEVLSYNILGRFHWTDEAGRNHHTVRADAGRFVGDVKSI